MAPTNASLDLSAVPAPIRLILERAGSDGKDGHDGIPFRARTNHVHMTWARTCASLPELYVQPESEDEIRKIVRLARQCRRRITLVGCGHSPSDLTCTGSWLVNLDRFDKVLSMDRRSGVCVVQAGIRVFQLGAELDRWGLAMPSLGSIESQSVAGLIATGTHGSSLRHGLVSDAVTALRITLADGATRSCSPEHDVHLFRAGLLSLGALGIVTEVTVQTVPAFSLAWEKSIDSDARLLSCWDTLWTQAEFVRIWWFPHTRRAVVWCAGKVTAEVAHYDSPSCFFDGTVGYHVYQNLLLLVRWLPRLTPWLEWFACGMQHGFRNGETTRVRAVQPSRPAFLINCLYSQYVDEWAIPLHKGPEALRRLASWLRKLQPGDEDYVDPGIPFSSEGVWAHSPVEVRVGDATVHSSVAKGNRPFLASLSDQGPVLYLNVLVYRPYHTDPTDDTHERYFKAFEWLMRQLGGRPHWAKNFYLTDKDFEDIYGDNLAQWRRVRDGYDPEGMFVGPWHRRYVMGDAEAEKLPLEEDGRVRV